MTALPPDGLSLPQSVWTDVGVDKVAVPANDIASQLLPGPLSIVVLSIVADGVLKIQVASTLSRISNTTFAVRV